MFLHRDYNLSQAVKKLDNLEKEIHLITSACDHAPVEFICDSCLAQYLWEKWTKCEP